MIEYPKECIIEEPIIFDSHAHYDDKKFDDIRDELLKAMPKNGICGIITCGCDKESSLSALSLAEKYDFIYAAVGIHPENIESRTTISDIEKLCANNKCVAIGEVGLDYYWNNQNRDKQIELFEKQIILAKSLDLPIIVHDREAHADTLELLKRHRPKGVVHCFSGSPEMAKEIIKLGMYIGIGGVITFKNSKRLPQTVMEIPEDRILIETDCPYLAPEPYRGHICHSGLIPLTATRIGEIKGKSASGILKITCCNAKKLFGI